jgi:hypothetical protein
MVNGIVTSDKFDVESILADVLSPTSAMVTAMYIRTVDRSGNVSITDNLDIYLLEMKEGSWKFKKMVLRLS